MSVATATAPAVAEPPRTRVGAAVRLWRRLVRLAPEASLVTATLVVLTFLIFRGYISGSQAPQFDFLGAYNTEAYAWWRDGSMLHPPQWMPYVWNGYPASVSLQSSGWYLPVGIPATLTTYTLHIAAVVQVLHVVWGALGVYALARAWGLGRLTSWLGLVAGYFAPGYFANAQHVDIVRAYAWAPWLLLLLSPVWPWRRWWAIPVASLLLWQTIVGIYPGNLVAFFYVGAFWVVGWLVVRRGRLRGYLLPLAISVAVAALLAAPKFVPAVALRGAGSPSGAEDSVFDVGIFGTLFFPYDGANLPTDMSMRSFFIPATCLALLAYVPWRDRRSWLLACTAAVSAFMSLPVFPWFHTLTALPGMDLSRFHFSDFRPILLLSIVMLGLLSASAVLREANIDRITRVGAELRLRRPGALAYLMVLIAVAIVVGVGHEFGDERWAPAVTILATSALVTAVAAGSGAAHWHVERPDARILVVILVALTAVSGTVWAYSTTRPWVAEREAAEVETYGSSVFGLIQQHADPAFAPQRADAPATRRPSRTPLAEYPIPTVDLQRPYNAAYYTGVAAVGGYANLKGNVAFERQMAAFQRPSTSADARAFYAAPGVAVAVPDGTTPTQDAVSECIATSRCGPGTTVEPIAYDVGSFTYRVTTDAAVALQLNESAYPGWHATTCDETGTCRSADVRTGLIGDIVVDAPAGTSTLTLSYTTPGLATSLKVFELGLGAVLLAGAAGVLMALQRRRAGATPRRPRPTWRDRQGPAVL